ncbi:erythroid membrane-associated protein [Osmerus eperlanus]|uniref:erythroid membrane-associated protein n=1 Tax=Osmerus eperlanus TaxID=29151 RepID=UPI002E127B6B
MGAVYSSLSSTLDTFRQDLKRMEEIGFPLEASVLRREPKVKRIQEYAVEVTLDSNTAHPRLILSEDRKMVKCGDRLQMLPDNPERFDRVVCVLGQEAFSSGRYYWEVEVGGKTDWDLGVASQSINRKGKVEVTPSNGYWFLSLRDKNKYSVRTELPAELPQKIGVFLDYDKGQVSFFNVEAKQHIYTFMDSFSESVFPFFSPCSNKSGRNQGPLIISPLGLAS